MNFDLPLEVEFREKLFFKLYFLKQLINYFNFFSNKKTMLTKWLM